MNSLHVKYLLIGGGGAGSAAAEAIRIRDPQGSILMIGAESSRPYNRPSLSKQYLRREKNRLEISIDPVGWYAQRRIDLRTGRRAAHLDTARHAVMLDNSEEVSYDKLLLAIGAAPMPLSVPGADLPNVFYLRTLDDCDRLEHAIDKARTEGRAHPLKDGAAKPDKPARGRAVIIGNGLLAIEVAASLKQMGLHVEIIIGREHAWAKLAGESLGRFITHYLEDHGVIVHNNVAASRLEGDGRVQRVVGSNGSTIDCDFVVAAMGIVQNRELLRGTPISAEKAILVDAHCRTSVEGIYAAGDCAAIYDPLFGKHRVLDHWDSARLTGTLAGANMAGDDAPYNAVSTFTSDIFDLRLHSWGEARFVDHRLVRGDATPGEPPAIAEIGVAADGRVAQVLAIGRTDEYPSYNELVRRRFGIDGNEEAMKDPTRGLPTLLGQ